MIAPLVFCLVALAVGGYLLLRSPTYLGTLLYALLMLAVLATGGMALGRPAPLWIVRWALPLEPTVLAFALREDQEIDLLIDGSPPILVALPWDEQKAVQLSGAAAKAAEKGQQLKMAPNGQPASAGQGTTKDNEPPMFYPAPPQALPPKQGE